MLIQLTLLQRPRRSGRRHQEQGVVMLVALIVLVVMTLAGIALMRSMDTTNLIAGNLAFKQATTNVADSAMETASDWLRRNNAAGLLDNDFPQVAYTASTLANSAYPLGEAFWKNVTNVNPPCYLPMTGGGVTCSPAETFVNGYATSFVIQRLCNTAGSRTASGCAVFPGVAVATGNNEGAGETSVVAPSSNVYYRITVRSVGPRNTVSYVQSIVAL